MMGCLRDMVPCRKFGALASLFVYFVVSEPMWNEVSGAPRRDVLTKDGGFEYSCLAR